MKALTLAALLLFCGISVHAQSLTLVKHNAKDTVQLKDDHILSISTDDNTFDGNVIAVDDSVITMASKIGDKGHERDTIVNIPFRSIVEIEYCPHQSTKHCLRDGSFGWAFIIVMGSLIPATTLGILTHSGWGFLVGELTGFFAALAVLEWTGADNYKIPEKWKIIPATP